MEPAEQQAVRRETFWVLALALGIGLALLLGFIRFGVQESNSGSSFEWLLIGLWAAAVSLCDRACGPLPPAEPLFAAFGTGLLCGAPAEGALIGLLLQSVWPGLVPMGGTRQPDAGLGSVAAVVWFTRLGVLPGPWRLAAALLVGVAGAALGERIEDRLRRRNERREGHLYGKLAVTGGSERRGADAPATDSQSADAAPVGRLVAAGAAEAAAKGLLGFGLLVALPVSVTVLLAGLGLPQLGSVSGRLPWPDGAAVTGAAVWCTAWPLLLFALGGFLALQFPRAWRSWRRPAGEESPRPGDLASPKLPRPSIAPALGLRGLLRALLLQAAFSGRHLQRTGFLYWWNSRPELHAYESLAGRRRLADEIAIGPAPNTHPIVAPALFGALETAVEIAARRPPPRPPARLLEIGAPLLAQWGDRVLWGGLRPAAAWCLLALLPLAPRTVIPLFLGMLTLVHLLARWRLYAWGRRAGWMLPGALQADWARMLPRGISGLLPLLALAAGLSLTIWIGVASPILPPRGWRLATGAIWFILGLLLADRIGARPLRWGWVCALVGAVGALVGRC